MQQTDIARTTEAALLGTAVLEIAFIILFIIFVFTFLENPLWSCKEFFLGSWDHQVTPYQASRVHIHDTSSSYPERPDDREANNQPPPPYSHSDLAYGTTQGSVAK